jgi:hypothetical protein
MHMKSSSLVLLAAMGLTLAGCGGGGGGSEPQGSAPPPSPAAANTAPTISAVANQALKQDAMSDVIGFEIADAETDASRLTLTVESSNPELISVESTRLAGEAGTRSMLLMPTAGVTGTATVTLVATDPQGLAKRQPFEVNVTSEQRSFREMVGTAYAQDTDTDGESIAGYTWVDTAEDDETAFDTLFVQ